MYLIRHTYAAQGTKSLVQVPVLIIQTTIATLVKTIAAETTTHIDTAGVIFLNLFYSLTTARPLVVLDPIPLAESVICVAGVVSRSETWVSRNVQACTKEPGNSASSFMLCTYRIAPLPFSG